MAKTTVRMFFNFTPPEQHKLLEVSPLDSVANSLVTAADGPQR